MLIVRDARALIRWRQGCRQRKFSVGFVPTLGALHHGHGALVRRAVLENDRVVVSIFVNPAQFGPREDFRRYPRTLSADRKLLTAAHADCLWLPSARAIYPEGYGTWVDVPDLSRVLCGVRRPGHFRGVTTVVYQLLAAVRPDRLYLGEKDFQQLTVLRRMVKDFRLPVRVRACRTVRDPDGLAASSRNRYLKVSERRRARVLFQALKDIRLAADQGERDAVALSQKLFRAVSRRADRVDYAHLVHPQTLQRLRRIGPEGARAVVAAWFANTRLIDNIQVKG